MWMIEKIGKVIDIIKKNGNRKYIQNSYMRQHLVKEMSDVLTYYRMRSFAMEDNLRGIKEILYIKIVAS